MTEHRNTQGILRAALAELQERREKLEPFIAELRDCDHGIKTLEKALGGNAARPAAKRNGGGSQKDKVLALLRESLDPLSAGQISEMTGIPRNSTYALLNKMKDAGEVTHEDGKYGLAAVAVSAME